MLEALGIMRCHQWNPANRAPPRGYPDSESDHSPSGLVNKSDIASRCNRNSAFQLARLHRIALVEDLLELLERTAHSLDGDEVPDRGLEHVPSDEDEDVVVLDVLQGDWGAVRVDEADLYSLKFERSSGMCLVEKCLEGTDR